MTIRKIDARNFAKWLLQENRIGRSYRAIAKDYKALDKKGKPLIKAGTLNRIANERGAWLPKSQEILSVLGLKEKERSPFAILPKWFNRSDEALSFFNGQRAKVKQMSRTTRQSVIESKRQ